MSVSKKEYSSMVKEASPPSPTLKNYTMAYLVGGAICCFGQGLTQFWNEVAGLSIDDAKCACSVTLVFIAALLTAIGWFAPIAKCAGAGTLVPITGFANAMVSPAIEFKSEGLITGVGVKLFTIAGPVLVYGVSASVIYGVIYWVCSMFI